MRDAREQRQIQLLTIKQAAEKLACSATNLYALIEAGDVAVVQVGARKGYRIDLRDLEAFIAQRKMRIDSSSSKPVPRRFPAKHLKL